MRITFKIIIIALLFFQNLNAQPWYPEILNENMQNYYMPDFSYAGYKWGEEPIPDFQGKQIDITQFGAVADDKMDDSDAILAALKKAHDTEGPVILYLPAGRYILKKILFIERSNIVIRGVDPASNKTTVLYMPNSLNELPVPEILNELEEYLIINNKRQKEKERGIDEPFSLYAWTGGFLWTNYPGARAKQYLSKYNQPRNVLAKIKEGQRGEHFFIAEDASKLQTGDVVRINLFNKEGQESSLINYLYDYQDVKIGSRHWETPDIALTRQEVMITAIEGNKVVIKEPLINDLRPEWHPDVSKWDKISNVGIENISFEFLYQEYNAHHVEYGFNAIYLTNTTHSWVRNVSFRNGDSGILTDMCSNITFDNIRTYGRKYHYAVHFGDCYNMLAKNLYIQAPVVHSLTFNTGSRSCVYTNCIVTQMPSLDQHSGLNYQNLFDNSLLYISDPLHKPLTMGGAKYWLPSHAAFSVFWNIGFKYLFENAKADTIRIKGVTDSPSARLIGVHANYPIDINYPINTYIEGMNRRGIAVKSLYEYQLQKRLNP